jgi:type IV pilus assembly protein PilC
MRLTPIKFPQHFYTWSGVAANGKNICGEVRAFSLNLAKAQLSEQGIKLKMIRKKIKPWGSRAKKIVASDIAIFFRQLATLINAGIPLVQAFIILSQNPDQPTLQNLIHHIKIDLESGNNLAYAFRKHSRYFDDTTCQLIHIAEQTGTLDTLLNRLANDHEKMLALKSHILQALLYPCIMLVLATAITIAMMLLVIPRFQEIFANFHAKLPAMTLVIIQIAEFIRHDTWVLVTPLLAGSAFYYNYQKFPLLKKLIDKTILQLPVLGKLLQKFIFARLARALATMLKAGVTITDALTMLVNLDNNSAIKNALTRLHHDINAGNRLHTAIQMNNVFPPLMAQMIKIGEESGSLEAILEKIAEFYEADISYWINNFSHLLEPLIIMILGVLIGGLVIAMYLPIFKLGTVI